jgi:hypothetical protein
MSISGSFNKRDPLGSAYILHLKKRVLNLCRESTTCIIASISQLAAHYFVGHAWHGIPHQARCMFTNEWAFVAQKLTTFDGS